MKTKTKLSESVWDFFYAIALAEATVYLFGIIYIQPTWDLVTNKQLWYLGANAFYSWSYLYLWIFGEGAGEEIVRFIVMVNALILAWWFIIKAYRERPRKVVK
ncbi:MAG: hypothetical protein AAB909_00515 [Patescibacteria group bacterium]